MKTSIYITIAFFTFIIAATLILSISAIGHEDTNKRSGIKEQFPLSEVKVLVVENDARVYIEESDSYAIQVVFMKDSVISSNFYRTNEDTLFINNVSASVEQINISCKNLSSVIAKNKAYVCFNSLVTEHLQINLDHAELLIQEFQVTDIDIQAVHSRISLQKGKSDTLSAHLTNESSIYCPVNINKVNVEKDSSSEYKVW